MSEVLDAFKRAEHHAEQLGKHINNALDAHVSANGDALGRHLRAAERSRKLLNGAHEALKEAIGTGVDPVANPTGAQGAQTSDGQEPRRFDPESIRQRDQRTAIDACHRARVAQMGAGRK